MNPHISVPRQHSIPSSFGGSSGAGSAGRGSSSIKMPRFFKRLFKFPQMDFEMAIWEMTSLLIAPKKVFKSMYYHKQTKNTWHRPDPSFTYLLSFFLLLTALAWGLAYSPSFGSIFRLSILFVFVHFIGTSLLISTIAYFAVGRIFGPKGAAASLTGLSRGSRMPRRGAAQGLFAQPGEKEQIEFGYCFDVSNRAFFPLYLHLYVLQFLLLPILTRNPPNFLTTFLGNTLYLSALLYYTYITFLGYNALPFLHNTELLLLPILVLSILWLVSLIAGWNVVTQGRGVEGLFWGV
ncbi:integral membrane protein, putative [Talaromyces stipitatus ATCC 10500]|uniref:Integral membrane protein, putative n=1 Tax=Talaromyces stipitatus (strain ATCC 10500 / CBS 375.48 / QM 6759 / NRRL 1006) TaxID=441959 RepID=B8MNJ7_TALSN|nr:integral membrane protein, putative [Talaromyces stipitatus ATCC 10500]EED14086.1 integral membrane protein, putative [Talaromyces stipitatus ATCC 10500]